MTDHSGEREDLQSHDLVARLARRLDEPQGVIDVRYAQQKYARIMNWLVERFGLLDQLMARYGIEDAHAGDSHLLMAAQPALIIEQPVGEQINYFSTTSQYFSSAMASQPPSPAAASQSTSSEARPSSFAEIINARPTPSADESLPPEGTYRVSRRAPPLSPASQSGSTDATASPDKPDRHKPVDGLNQSTSAQGISERSSDVQTPPLIYAKSVIEREEKILLHAEAHEWPSGATVKTQISSTPSSPAIRQAEIEIANFKQSPASSLPLVNPQVGPAQIDDHQHSGARQSIETAPTAQDGRRRDVVSEIRDDSLSPTRPDIVWRKSSDNPAADFTGRDAGGHATAAARRTDTFASTTAQEFREAAVPANAQATSDEIRIEQLSPQVIRTISEQVIRTISFDLKLERERRGMSKWR